MDPIKYLPPKACTFHERDFLVHVDGTIIPQPYRDQRGALQSKVRPLKHSPLRPYTNDKDPTMSVRFCVPRPGSSLGSCLKRVPVATLVATAFLTPLGYDPKIGVVFIDGNTGNHHLSNLRPATGEDIKTGAARLSIDTSTRSFFLRKGSPCTKIDAKMYLCEVYCGGALHQVGIYDSDYKAARAHDAALALLGFPKGIPLINPKLEGKLSTTKALDLIAERDPTLSCPSPLFL